MYHMVETLLNLLAFVSVNGILFFTLATAGFLWAAFRRLPRDGRR